MNINIFLRNMQDPYKKGCGQNRADKRFLKVLRPRSGKSIKGRSPLGAHFEKLLSARFCLLDFF